IFQERLIPEYDDRLIIDYESPVGEDTEFVQKTMAAMPGAYRVDEHRAVTGHPELKNGEGQVFLVPALLTVKATLEEAQLQPVAPPPAVPAPAAGASNGGPPPQPATPAGAPSAQRASRPPGDGWYRSKRAVKSAYE